MGAVSISGLKNKIKRERDIGGVPGPSKLCLVSCCKNKLYNTAKPRSFKKLNPFQEMLFCLSENLFCEDTVQLGNIDCSRIFSEGEIPLLPTQKTQ